MGYNNIYRKIPKISPGAYFFQWPFLRGLVLEGLIYGNLRLQIDWVSLIVRSKFTVFALLYFVFEGNFPSTSPPGGGGGLYLENRLIWRGDLTEGFFASVVWGTYTWRGLFSEFYGRLVVAQRIRTQN